MAGVCIAGTGTKKKLKVKVGDQVKTGQLIGLIGATGRVSDLISIGR